MEVRDILLSNSQLTQLRIFVSEIHGFAGPRLSSHQVLNIKGGSQLSGQVIRSLLKPQSKPERTVRK